MSLSFKHVQDIFDRVFQQAIDTKGQVCMEAQGPGYLAETLADLSRHKNIGDAIYDRRIDTELGDGEPIAWVYDPGRLGLVEIADGASDNELLTLAGKFYEYGL